MTTHPIATLWQKFKDKKIATAKAKKKKAPVFSTINANWPGWKSFKKANER
jgi:hypothetical protein